jgi:hypothetical protein
VTRPRLATLAIATLALLVSGALAYGSGSIDLRRFVVAGGGGRSSAGGLTLSGTMGQHDVGESSGVGLRVLGGFWHGTGPPTGPPPPTETPGTPLPTATGTPGGATPAPMPRRIHLPMTLNRFLLGP